MRLAPPFALLLAACTSDPPPPPAAALPPPTAPTSAPARNAAPPAPPSSSASAPAPAPPPPSPICELAKAHHGAWQPTVDEVIAAAILFPDQCLGPRSRPPAIRACAAKLGTATVKVGLGTLDEGVICEESFLPATWNGRRWIVLDVNSFSQASSTGSAFTAELRGAKAVRYVDNEGLVADCKNAAGAPSRPPADWAKLPTDLARFLCGRGG